MKTNFHTRILQMGNNTGLEVPPENIAELGAGKRPAVRVKVSDYTYSSTVAVMGGRHLIAFNSAHRAASGLKGGDTVEVTLELETVPRTVEVPADLQKALTAAGLEAVFARQAPSKRKEFVRQVEETKGEATRARRVEKILAQLGGA
ncbi:MAG: YdeI/OmpD-associated family protein [Meiothermus sp.]|nr:YdeI/OmpD-associated family protein [Meiothermus sp.]